jgi:sulfite reductase (ferredoxin)
VGQHVAPIFQVVLGGQTQGNAASFGLSMGKVSAKNVPVVVQRLTDIYKEGENFAAFTQRVGKGRIKQAIDEFDRLPDYSEHPEFYRDSRQPWDYFMSTGVGECAGEVVTQAEFRLEEADRLLFAATLQLEKGRDAQTLEESATTALQAMKAAADGLLSTRGLLLSDNWSPSSASTSPTRAPSCRCVPTSTSAPPRKGPRG